MNDSKRGTVLAVLIGLGLFVFYFLNFQGLCLGYWDTYIVAPAMFSTGHPTTFVGEDGRPVYEYDLAGRLPDDLMDREQYGIISKDQRLGTGIMLSVPFLFFGLIGFRLAYAAAGALTFLLGRELGKKLFTSEAAGTVFGVLLAANPLMISMDRLNPNFFAIPLLTAIVLLLVWDRPAWLLAGLLYGTLGGIRNVAIIIGPALLLWMLRRRDPLRAYIRFAAGAFIMILPFLYWNGYAFGSSLIHSSQYAHFEGFRPTFEHHLFGISFQFNGLMNWPFHDQVVRTPHYPFPTFLTIPLTLVMTLGVAASAMALLGLCSAERRRSSEFWLFFPWLSLYLLFFLFFENWEEVKTTFIALALPPLCVFVVDGALWLTAGGRRLRRAAVFLCTALAIKGLLLAARNYETPADFRWYERFPKAAPGRSLDRCLTDSERKDWTFHATAECPEEIAFQREKLTRGRILPSLLLEKSRRPSAIKDEWGARSLETRAIWSYIYGGYEEPP